MAIALSWSRLSDFQSCPRKFYLKYIEKAFKPEEKSIHLIKGEQLHKQLENYVVAKNGGGEMPPGFSPNVQETLPFVDKLFASFSQVHPEAQVAADVKWGPQEWFGANVAWRAIWDVIAINSDQIFIGDYKSGRVYDYGSSYGQLHLSAVMALNRYNVDKVHVAYIYIEHKKITKFTVSQNERSQVQAHFDEWYDKVNAEKDFKATPNEYCKYCPANKAQCQFSRKL